MMATEQADRASVSTAGGVQPRAIPVLAASVPAVLGTCLVIAFICVELSGGTLSTIKVMNISEAAGLGLGAETLRRLSLGEDPSVVRHVRPEIISSSIPEVSALEAAIFVEKIELVRALDRRGAITGDAQRRALACLAADREASDLVEYLTRPGDPACEPGAARLRIEQRAQAPGTADAARDAR